MGGKNTTNVLRKKRKSEKIKDGENSKKSMRTFAFFQTEGLGRTSSTNLFFFFLSGTFLYIPSLSCILISELNLNTIALMRTNNRFLVH